MFMVYYKKFTNKSSITNLIKSNAIPGQRGNEVKFAVLQIITQLFDDETSFNNAAGYGNSKIQERAPLVFAYLISDNDDLQKAAMETNAIVKLSKIILSLSTDPEPVNKLHPVDSDALIISNIPAVSAGNERQFEVI